MMAATLIIINHAAAKARNAWPIVRQHLQATGISFESHETTHAGDATDQTRAALERGCTTIAVIGGDGTLSETAEGFFKFGANTNDTPQPIRPSACLAVLPAGTGDDFARGLSGGRQPLQYWIQRLVEHLGSPGESQTRNVDLIFGRCDNFTRPFICLNASTLGIGGETGARVAAQGSFLRRFSGEVRFVFAAVGALANWRERRVVVTVDNRVLAEAPMNLVAIANNAYAGAGMMLSPEAQIDDGTFDVVIASGLTRLQVLRELPRIHSGGHVANPKVRIARGSCASIHTFSGRDTMVIEADGNVRGRTPADYRIMPGALRFVV